ncbi:MAG: hypothetical protein NTU98_05875 [Bacteroidetes bacterium]|nr:hypothetical protein [Bacteroidota bacterium]
MKKYLIIILATSLLPFVAFAQKPDSLAKSEAVKQQDTLRPPAKKQHGDEFKLLKSGFYIKIGPTFPVGNYSNTQYIYDETHYYKPSVYFPAKTGAAMDLGFIIYIGPKFANQHLRAGIDATFLTFWFNSISSDSLSSPKTQYWYFYGGQKFGPVISICPVDKLVIDLSYKINAFVAYLHHYMYGSMNDEWGYNATQSELSMTIRYWFTLISFQYNFGQVKYNDFDSNKPSHYVDNSTFRFMIGFKF